MEVLHYSERGSLNYDRQRDRIMTSSAVLYRVEEPEEAHVALITQKIGSKL